MIQIPHSIIGWAGFAGSISMAVVSFMHGDIPTAVGLVAASLSSSGLIATTKVG